MKKNVVFIFLVWFLITFVSCKQGFENRIVVGEKNAKEEVNAHLSNKKGEPFYDTLIKSKETAMAVAEPILFGIYGMKHIIEQRPYEIYMIDGYWYIAGTLPKGLKGGVFEIIISSKDGQVIKLTHGK